MKRQKRGVIAFAVMLTLFAGFVPQMNSEAAKKVALSTKKLTVNVGKTKTLKLKNNKKKAKWTVTSGKKNIKLKAKKKTSVKIAGEKVGTAKVQVKVGKKNILAR